MWLIETISIWCQRIITNPQVEAIIIVFASGIIKRMFGKNQEKSPLTRKDNPLFLPRGSVRAIITIGLTIIVGITFWFPDSFIPNEVFYVWLVAVGYYVGYRTDNTQIKERK